MSTKRKIALELTTKELKILAKLVFFGHEYAAQVNPLEDAKYHKIMDKVFNAAAENGLPSFGSAELIADHPDVVDTVFDHKLSTTMQFLAFHFAKKKFDEEFGDVNNLKPSKLDQKDLDVFSQHMLYYLDLLDNSALEVLQIVEPED